MSAPLSIPTTRNPVEDGVRRLRSIFEECQRLEQGALVVLHTPFGRESDAVIKRFRRHLLGERIPLYEGECLPGGATYRPLREIVFKYLRTLDDVGLMDDEIQALSGRLTTVLELPETLPAEADTAPSPADRQLQFFEDLGRLLSALSERLPAVVMIHDLHVADSATRAAVEYLLENVVTDPVGHFAPPGMRGLGFRGLLVVTANESGGVVERLKSELDGRQNADFVSLRGVGEDEVRRFLQSDEVVEQLLEVTGGSVENLREVLRALPRKVEDLYARRVERLDRPERRLLEALAVIGQPVTPDFLLRVADTGGDPPSLASLAEERLIVRHAQRGEVLVDFPSIDNQRQIYDRTSEDRRRHLHGRVGALFEERSKLGGAINLETVAHHYLRSNVREKAVQYALDAAERLHITFAYPRAREILLALLPQLEAGETRDTVLERLVEIDAAMNQHDAALGRIDELLERDETHATARLVRRKGEILMEMGSFEDALEAFARADELLSTFEADAGDGEESEESAVEGEIGEERIRIVGSRAEALYGLGDYEQSREVAEKGLALVKQAVTSEGVRQAIRLTNTIGKIELFQGDYTEAERCFEENVERAREHNWPDEEVRALFNQGIIALQRRRYDDAEEVFQRCIEFGRRTANPITRAFCLLNLAVVYHKTLRYGDALDAYLHGLATFKQSQNELQFAVTAMNLGALYETLGEREKARELLETSLDVTREKEMKYFQGRGLYILGTLALDEGKFGEASEALTEAEELLEHTGSTLFGARVRIALARASHGNGNLAARDEYFEGALVEGDSAEAAEVEAERLLYEGVVAFDEERFEEAESSLVRALAIFERHEIHERIWLCRLHLAKACLALDQGGRARDLLASAQRLIEQIAENVPDVMREVYLGEIDEPPPEGEEHPAPTRRAEVRTLLEALERGDGRRGTLRAARAAARRSREIPRDENFDSWRARYGFIVGQDERLLQIFRMIDRVGRSDSPVLIQGESGTGKELIAEALHKQSEREEGPFVKVNCAAFVETLLMSELFGHEKGAFTGALARKKGRFELADGGTLFLDEIGDISQNTQVALLRVLQEQTFERVGGSETLSVDVRLVCATNRNLEEMVKEGTFRLDLYYRLKGVVLEMPPLRDRRGDIPLLVDHFCRIFARDGQASKRLSRDAMTYLVRYSWPGNVRELENFVRSLILFVDDDRIELADILEFEDFFTDGAFLDEVPEFMSDYKAAPRSAELAGAAGVDADGEPLAGADEVGDEDEATAAGLAEVDQPTAVIAEWALRERVGLPDLRKKLEMELIKQALIEAEGNITRAAELLDMKRPRLSQIVNGSEELEEVRRKINEG